MITEIPPSKAIKINTAVKTTSAMKHIPQQKLVKFAKEMKKEKSKNAQLISKDAIR